jgi:hypothetical protein
MIGEMDWSFGQLLAVSTLVLPVREVVMTATAWHLGKIVAESSAAVEAIRNQLTNETSSEDRADGVTKFAQLQFEGSPLFYRSWYLAQMLTLHPSLNEGQNPWTCQDTHFEAHR